MDQKIYMQFCVGVSLWRKLSGWEDYVRGGNVAHSISSKDTLAWTCGHVNWNVTWGGHAWFNDVIKSPDKINPASSSVCAPCDAAAAAAVTEPHVLAADEAHCDFCPTNHQCLIYRSLWWWVKHTIEYITLWKLRLTSHATA